MSAIRIAKQELRPFLTPKGLAEYLSISERTVRDMLSKQRIPSYKVEGQRRIDPADVEKYLARHRDDRDDAAPERPRWSVNGQAP